MSITAFAPLPRSFAIGSDAFLPKPIRAETLLEQLQQHLNLTWPYGDSPETAEEEISQAIVLSPSAELEKLYKLSLVGDIDELEKEIAILVKSDVKLKSFVAKIRAFLKEYQVDELSEWLEGKMHSKLPHLVPKLSLGTRWMLKERWHNDK